MKNQTRKQRKRGGAKVFGFHVPFTAENVAAPEEDPVSNEQHERLQRNAVLLNEARKHQKEFDEEKEREKAQSQHQQELNTIAQNLGYTSNKNRREKNHIAQLLGFPDNVAFRNADAKKFGYENHVNRKIVNRYAQLEGFTNDLQRKQFAANQYTQVQTAVFQSLQEMVPLDFLKTLELEFYRYLDRIAILQHYPTFKNAERRLLRKDKTPPSSPKGLANIRLGPSRNSPIPMVNEAYHHYPETSLTREELHELELRYWRANFPFFASGPKGVQTRFLAFLIVGLDSYIYQTAMQLFTKNLAQLNLDRVWLDTDKIQQNALREAQKMY